MTVKCKNGNLELLKSSEYNFTLNQGVEPGNSQTCTLEFMVLEKPGVYHAIFEVYTADGIECKNIKGSTMILCLNVGIAEKNQPALKQPPQVVP
jgi:hypothetical protein